MKGLIIQSLPYFLIALFLDLIQMGIEVFFGFIGAFTGTLGGASAGGAFGWKICSHFGGTILTTCTTAGAAVGGILGSFLDPFLAPVATPIAIFIGTIVNIAISLSVGTGFIVLLFAVSGMFDGMIVMPFYLGKILPLSDVAPLWSVMVFRLVVKKATKNLKKAAPEILKGAVTGAIKGVKGGPEAMAAGAAIGASKVAVQSMNQNTKKETSTPPNNVVMLGTRYKQPKRNIDGIIPGAEKYAA